MLGCVSQRTQAVLRSEPKLFFAANPNSSRAWLGSTRALAIGTTARAGRAGLTL